MSVKEIARKANVSIGTVDRVIHNRGRVSRKTRERVQKIIKELNYRPNIYARSLSLAKNYHFGVVMPRLFQDSGYWRISARGIERAQKELEAYKVTIHYFLFDRYSESSFQRALNECMGREPEGLLIAPVLSEIARKLTTGIPPELPYSFFDCAIPGSQPLSFVGQNSRRSGALGARLLHLLTQDQGQNAIIKILPEDNHINERIKGFLASARSQGGLPVRVYDADSREGEEGLARLTSQIIAGTRNLRGIFVTNAWTYPVAKYVKSVNLKKKISIVGYDLTAPNIRFLKEGMIDFIISQRPALQGYLGILSLYRHVVLKEAVSPKMIMPLDIITRENLAYYQD
jgi:LacI family transcriptional regulator